MSANNDYVGIVADCRQELGHDPGPAEQIDLQEERSMKFRPLHDRIVVRRIEADAKTKGGIIIPDTVKEKPQEGEVVAVGPGGQIGRAHV